MMSLEDAILHCKDRAKADCSECAEEHQRLAEWLEELKIYKDLEKQEMLLVKVYKLYVVSRCTKCGRAEYRISEVWVSPELAKKEGFYKTKEDAKKALENMY